MFTEIQFFDIMLCLAKYYYQMFWIVHLKWRDQSIGKTSLLAEPLTNLLALPISLYGCRYTMPYWNWKQPFSWSLCKQISARSDIPFIAGIVQKPNKEDLLSSYVYIDIVTLDIQVMEKTTIVT